VAQPEPRQKGLRTLPLIGLLVGSAVVAFPISFIAAVMMSPWLGRLETRYGVELVGHSGPSDWIYETVFGVTTILVFACFVWLARLVARPGSDGGAGGSSQEKAG